MSKINNNPIQNTKKTNISLFNQFTLVVVLALVFGITGGALGNRIFTNRQTSLDTPSGQQKIISSQSQLISAISKSVSPSVVSINVSSQASNNNLQNLFGITPEPTQSAGTGIIISSDGIVVTNKHVVSDNPSNISITTSSGKKFDNVKVLAIDPRTNYDIAFLKISGVNNLTPAKLGDSSKLQVGDSVLAIGYALGEFENTVTSGIVSGLGRPIVAGDSSSGSAESLNNLLQTDAAMNPGNSGGPLVNMSGEVIGINTAVAGNAQNIGFSIPINDVKSQINSILQKGKLEVPYLGVHYIMLNSRLKQAYDLPTDQGAWLKTTNQNQAVINGSPADQAGLKENDIITKINEQEINSDNTLATVLGKYKVGDQTTISYIRDGKTQTTKATLAIAPEKLNT